MKGVAQGSLVDGTSPFLKQDLTPIPPPLRGGRGCAERVGDTTRGSDTRHLARIFSAAMMRKRLGALKFKLSSFFICCEFRARTI